MPRKDPITGCNVLTWGEFWESEAEHENKKRDPERVNPITSAELQEDFFTQMEQIRHEQEKSLSDPEETLKLLQDIAHYSEQEPPVHVIKVLKASYDESMRSSHTFVRAVVRMANGLTTMCEAWGSHYSGSFYEPPDSECELQYIPLVWGIPIKMWKEGHSAHIIFGNKALQIWWNQTYHPDPHDWGERLWPWFKKLRHGKLIGIQICKR